MYDFDKSHIYVWSVELEPINLRVREFFHYRYIALLRCRLHGLRMLRHIIKLDTFSDHLTFDLAGVSANEMISL